MLLKSAMARKKKKTPRVLIVDDEANLTLSIMEFLSKKLRCWAAYSYEEAIDFLSKNEVDLVITDIKLPGKDGFELLLWLRKNRPETKVILMTAYGSPSFKEKAKKEGALLYIEKPIDLGQLMRMVGKILSKEGYSIAAEEVELVDILQIFSFYERPAVVKVENEMGEVGWFGIKGSKVVWAATESKKGMNALMDILGWTHREINLEDFREGEEGSEVEVSILELQEEILKTQLEVLDEDTEVEIIIKNNKKEEEMAKLDELLEKLKEEIPEMVAVGIIDVQSGIAISGLTTDPKIDINTGAAAVAEILRALGKSQKIMGANLLGDLEDVLITRTNSMTLIRSITGEYAIALLIPATGNLGLARVILKKFKPLFEEVLKKLS